MGIGGCIAQGCNERVWAGRLCREHHPRADFNERIEALEAQLAESEERRLTTRICESHEWATLHCPDCSEKRQAGEG